MKIKSLLALVLVACVLGWLAYHRASRTAAVTKPDRVGAPVLPGFAVQDVAAIRIQTATTNLVLHEKDGAWRVATRFDYPARLEKVRELVMSLRDLKIGQVVYPSAAQRSELRLQPPGTEPSDPETTAVSIRLENTAQRPLAALLIGKQFMRRSPGGGGMTSFGYPDGQYVATEQGEVCIVAQSLERMRESISTWLDETFVNVPAARIQSMSSAGPRRAAFTLSRSDADQFILADAVENETTLDNAKVKQFFGALSYLGFDDVVDPAIEPESAGLAEPITLTARLKDGQVYTLLIGTEPANERQDRYVRVRVDYEAPESPPEETEPSSGDDPAAAARELNERLSPWTYIVKSYRIEQLLVPRAEFIAPEEAKPAESGPDEPAAETGAATTPLAE